MEKTNGLMYAVLFAFVVLLSTASAVNLSSISKISQTSGSFEVNVTSTVNETVDLTIGDIIQGESKIEFTIFPNSVEVTNESGNYSTVTVTYDSTDFNFKYGKTYSTILTADGNGTAANATRVITFKDTDFCEGVSNEAGLTVEVDSYSLKKGFGDVDEKVYLLSDLEAEVLVENTGIHDADKIRVEWELYTSEGRRIDSGELSTFSLDSGDDTTVYIEFTLDKKINYFENADPVLYVRAIGEVDDSDSVYNNQDTCKFTKDEGLNIETGDDFVVLELETLNDQMVEESYFDTKTFECGEELNFIGKIWNIGDQDQDGVYVRAYSKDLGINDIIEIGTVKAFEDTDFRFTHSLSEELDEKNHRIDFEVYDEYNKLFENDANDESIAPLTFKVEGKCKIVEPLVDVRLASGKVIEGEEVELKFTLVNKEDKDVLFTLAASEYESWADSVVIEPSVANLTEGAAKEFSIKLKIKEDIEGTQEFKMNVLNEGNLVTVQPIALEVEKGSFNWSDLIQDENTRLIGIIVLNVILILLIIFIARGILRR